MKHCSFTILILSMIMYSCNKNADPEMTIISGVIHSSEAKKVYLSKIDHFDYMNNDYVIDSSIISKDGTFEFSPHNLSSNLVSITPKNFQPFTLQILNDAPQNYFWGNCEKFYTSSPTFYIEENQDIDFEWFENNSIDSISNLNHSVSASNQIKLRAFYLNSKRIDAGNLDLDRKVEIQENWNQLLLEREYDLSAAGLKQVNSSNSFDNYIYTEIYLGSLNYFLTWIERFHPEEVTFAIRNPEKQSIYSVIFSEYKTHKWNPKSFEYYKFTERYVNHSMNINSMTFKNYHEPSEKKLEIAKQVLKGENKKRYALLMKKQLKKGYMQ